MGKKIKDLTIEEFQILISNAIKEVMDDLIEDLIALSDEEYLQSVKSAREDYEEGRVKSFEEIFNI